MMPRLHPQESATAVVVARVLNMHRTKDMPPADELAAIRRRSRELRARVAALRASIMDEAATAPEIGVSRQAGLGDVT